MFRRAMLMTLCFWQYVNKPKIDKEIGSKTGKLTTLHFILEILSRIWGVTIDGVWIGDWIY
jgi:hypothetical protein